jgi:hypothetical protein
VGEALELCLEIAAGASIRDQVLKHLGVRQGKVTSEEWKRALGVMYKRRERARRRVARAIRRLQSQGRVTHRLPSAHGVNQSRSQSSVSTFTSLMALLTHSSTRIPSISSE